MDIGFDPSSEQHYQYFFNGWLPDLHSFKALAVQVTYVYGSALAAVSETHTPTQLLVDVTPGNTERVVADSLDLRLGGKVYQAASGGVYADVNPATGAGVFVGSLNPDSGIVALNAWVSGAANTPVLNALTTRLGVDTCSEIIIRSPAYPVAVGSATIQAIDVDGNTLTATADSNGDFEDTGILGTFTYANGVGYVRFGEWVAASGHENEPWYHADAVVSGQIIQPIEVLVDSIQCNFVSVESLPTDDANNGLSANRLNRTGRVRIFREGKVVALHHSNYSEVGSATAGGTVDLGRTGLHRVWVRDSTGKRVTADKYSANLATGIFTWAAPLSLVGWVAPFRIHHQIMHKSKLAKVFSDGRVVLRLPAPRAFPLGSFVSSALWIDDMKGRVSASHHQSAWTGNWLTASPNGEPDWQYDEIGFPITVHNTSSTDSYAIVVQSDPTKYKIISKSRGVLAKNIVMANDYTLVNRETDNDEFTIYGDGFSLDGVNGNCFVFTVVGATYPVDLCMTIAEGAEATEVDYCSLQFMAEI